MARQRDYRAEEARRNARAREAGFSSRAQERRVRGQSQRWSNRHAEKPIATYSPRMSAEYVAAYHDVFVERRSSHDEFMDHLYEYMVDFTESMTPEEFWAKYGRS